MSKGISLFITVVASTFLIIIVAGHTGQYLANRKEESRDESNINRDRLGSFYGAIISII